MGQNINILATSNVISEDVARHNENIATLRSNFSGTGFPATPLDGQTCWRTDRGDNGKKYTYSGNVAIGEDGWLTDDELSDITAEIENSRGTKLTLDQRLDIALNEDGTLKSSIEAFQSQWILASVTFTYIDSSNFKTDGNTTDIFLDARRVKVNLGSSVVYGEVISTIYDGGQDETTVTLDITTLDNTLVSVEHSLISLDETSGSLSVYNKTESDILHRRVPMKVKAAEALTKGDLVKWSAYNSGEDAIEVVKTDLQTDVCIGIVNQDLALNEFGDVVARGIIEGMDTSGQSGGTVMYSTGGGLASPTKPSGTYQAVAYVVKVHAVTGAAMIDISEPVTPTVVNDTLTSTSTTETLSANQGRVLKNTADALNAEVIKENSTAQTKIGDLTIGETVVVSSWSYSGTTITVNTSANHNVIVGQYFSVKGLVATTNAPNGRWAVVGVTDSDTITFTASDTPTGTATVSSAELSHGDLNIHRINSDVIGINDLTLLADYPARKLSGTITLSENISNFESVLIESQDDLGSINKNYIEIKVSELVVDGDYIFCHHSAGWARWTYTDLVTFTHVAETSSWIRKVYGKGRL